jgi:hypothetical protein
MRSFFTEVHADAFFHCPPYNDSVQLRKLLQNGSIGKDAFIKAVLPLLIVLDIAWPN